MPAKKKKRAIPRQKQKRMAENTLLPKEAHVNREAKDSVLCDLFGKQEYLFQLY